jgi:hypothetical protein
LQIADLFPRVTRAAVIAFEIAILSALILVTRCANYPEVFVAGNVYFTDADCYARMIRARICAEHPGRIVRHHDFENFPAGTNPHTTAPLDYLILGLSIFLQPFTTNPLDLAGALISPLLALLGGWFLCWWSRRMRFRYRWAMLILYAISPILVHGTELGRPDHQSLLIVLVAVAVCAEWSLRTEGPPGWAIVSGIAWAMAIWVSAYEPLVLLLALVLVGSLQDRQSLFGIHRRIGWIVFVGIIVIALLVERRVPSLAIFHRDEIFMNWSRTIGELSHVSPLSSAWFRWAGYMIAVTPLLIWVAFRNPQIGVTSRRALPIFILLIATYLLTIWQARWAYFFALILALALPLLLDGIKPRTAVWIAFTLSILPILRHWDEQFWPNETEFARRAERRIESTQLQGLATALRSPEVQPVLAPWWLSPAIAYWSGQPAVAGSSHESLSGIAETARFYLAHNWQTARDILDKRKVAWVLAYDSDRVAENSAAILPTPVPPDHDAVCFVLDRMPARAPRFLSFLGQNATAKLYRVNPTP